MVSFVPKKFPSHLSNNLSQDLLWFKAAQGLISLRHLFNTDNWKLGFEFAQGQMDFKSPILLSWIILDPQNFSCQVSSLGSHFCSVNWSVDLKINCIGEKVNYGQFIVKLHNFLSMSTLWTHICHFIKFWP